MGAARVAGAVGVVVKAVVKAAGMVVVMAEEATAVGATAVGRCR